MLAYSSANINKYPMPLLAFVVCVLASIGLVCDLFVSCQTCEVGERRLPHRPRQYPRRGNQENSYSSRLSMIP